jgi:nucleoid-associated protein YgaU
MRSRKRARTATIQLLSGLFFFLFFLSSASGFAQSLGDVARQERERRANPKRPRDVVSRRPRVYTNEDLARPRILDPQDRQAPESAPQSAQVAPSAPSAEPPAPRSLMMEWPKDIPLGDVARYYRKEREKEAAGTLEFATKDAPTMELEQWLFPNPLASPLPTTLDSFFPPREVSEPAWDAPLAPGETVRVERGDTLWKIAERHLGSGNQWPKITAANPGLQNPNQIQAGQRLFLPAKEVASKEVTPADTQIQVRAGDSLWKLAAAQLGTGHGWACLAAANPQIEDANRIYPGQMLVIPTACYTGA